MSEEELREAIQKNPRDIVSLSSLYLIHGSREEWDECLNVENRILNLAEAPSITARELFHAWLCIAGIRKDEIESIGYFGILCSAGAGDIFDDMGHTISKDQVWRPDLIEKRSQRKPKIKHYKTIDSHYKKTNEPNPRNVVRYLWEEIFAFRPLEAELCYEVVRKDLRKYDKYDPISPWVEGRKQECALEFPEHFKCVYD